ncbi:MAG: TIGR03960 family B12-binding radical SAM protein [Nitrospinae bacterium]|nr:TIGR03960 family B12-binding radical SAM protein [Nitrospinota bacterium]
MTEDVNTRFERILSSIRKPTAYLGTEKNSVRKDHKAVSASMALAFPDIYDIGMSHLGLKILYHVINREPDLLAERVFAPEEDFAELIQKDGITLPSLETKTPLSSFDIVGFTIPYELSYTTILWMLDLAGIPIWAKDRDDSMPLIIGGGAGVYNPEPIADFFDLFFLGDGENGAVEIMRAVSAMKHAPKKEKLLALSKIPGVYVPSFFDVSYNGDGTVREIKPLIPGYEKAVRVFLPTLAESPYPFDLVAPFGQPVHDRLNVEIDRGCAQGCRFCQAGTTYRPARERTPEQVMEIVETALAQTGYDEVSMTSLSAGDYSKIGELLTALMDKYAHERVSVSMPSLRAATVTEDIVKQVGRVRHSTFTIAAEAASQRLRNVINKKVSDEDIFHVAGLLLENDFQSLKLYFMIGLPTETWEDVEAIYTLADRLANFSVNRRRFKNINVSVSNFVPKAHTAFQWQGQEPQELLKEKKERLFALMKRNRRLTFKWHDSRMSHMEAVFSRGDRTLARAVEEAYKMGARLDPWTERFDFNRWMKAFEKVNLDSRHFANRSYDITDMLPWNHIDTGLSLKYFTKELECAQNGIITADCKVDKCLACGLDPRKCFKPYEWQPYVTPEVNKAPEAPIESYRYRLVFQKTGYGRFFGHLELQKIIYRSIRVARLPIAFSLGFSPHPKIAFGPALPQGVESLEEFLEVELWEGKNCDELVESLNGAMPGGIRFVRCEFLPVTPAGKVSVNSQISGFTYRAATPLPPEVIKTALERFNNATTAIVSRVKENSVKELDVKNFTSRVELGEQPGDILFESRFNQQGGTVKPYEILQWLFPAEDVRSWRVIKTGAIIQPDRR